MESGSRLYRKMFDQIKDDAMRAEMREAWGPTPWMVECYDDGDRDGRIHRWCLDFIGPVSNPFRDKPGSWRSGNATIYGWSWYGFASEADMRRFCDHFITREDGE